MKLTIEGNTKEIKKVLQAIAGSKEHKEFVTKSELKKTLKNYPRW